MIMPTMGLAQYLPYPADYFFLDASITLNCILPLSTICPIIYRYLLFCRDRDLSPKEAYGFMASCMAFGIVMMRLKLTSYHQDCPMTAVHFAAIKSRLQELKAADPNFDETRYYIASAVFFST